jgi:hypothetical protein
MVHLQSIAPDTCFIEQLFSMLHSFFGSEISFQEMAVADFSATHQNAVRPCLECFQNVDGINLAGAGQFYDSHGRRILQAHGTGHVSRRVRAVGAHHGYYLGFKVLHISLSC